MRALRATPVLLLVLIAPASFGCVEHRLYVKTDPPDALVTVDGRDARRPERKGSSAAALGDAGGAAFPRAKGGPAVLGFEHYGIRRVVARREGYRAVDRLVTLDPPWYQLFPLDLVTDVLVPWTIEDAREVELSLPPRDDLDAKGADALIQRAHDFAQPTERHP